MTQAVILGYARSPFTQANKGQLAGVRSDEMVAQVILGLLDKINHDDIEDLLLGCAFPEGEQGLNIARLVTFLCKLPLGVAGQTINRFCGSSMQAIHSAVGNIELGYGELFIAAGVESMSRVPMAGFNPMPHPTLYANYPEAYEAMGITAENLAQKYKISRSEQDEFASASHEKAVAALKKSYFVDEIIPINHDDVNISLDGCIREGTNINSLKELKPAFLNNGSVTAGTSSPLTDGASAVIVASEKYAKKYGLKPMAKIRSFAVSGCAPEIMGIGPVDAVKKALNRANLSLSDIDIIELNEAFAAQSLAVIKELGLNKNKINIDGGAIAIGHPLGASGARITGKAASLLQRTGSKYALATMCIGGGMGIATILESV